MERKMIKKNDVTRRGTWKTREECLVEINDNMHSFDEFLSMSYNTGNEMLKRLFCGIAAQAFIDSRAMVKKYMHGVIYAYEQLQLLRRPFKCAVTYHVIEKLETRVKGGPKI